MNQQLVGFLLIAGFASILIASFVGPPRLFQEPASETRLAIIAQHPTRWIASNVFYALAGIATAIGLALFSLHLRGSINAWINGLAAAAYILGTVVWVILMIIRTVNPAPYFSNYHFSPLTVALVLLTVIGLLLYGVVFLQASYPLWLGAALVAGMALIGGWALLFPSQFYGSFPPQILYLFTLAAGIALVRQ
jgi:hypothetical protein